MAAALQPFALDVSAAALDDLRERLRRTRLPGEPARAGWSYGTSRAYLEALVRYWRDDYDWRAVERRLNRFPHFLATVGGHRIHLIHERGSGADPLPLVLTHGWPGSFVEFEAVIEPLAHPERFGGRAEDAFDVIVPTLPGYGWSSAPAEPMTTREMAALWHALITSGLGYARYVAQGGDWGSLVTSWLGVDFPESVAAIHVNMMGLRPWLGEGSRPLSPAEKAWVARAQEVLRRETGYQAIQGTKPQTLAYAVTDSPAGLAAWIVEKFRTWCDCNGDPETVFTKDELLTNITLYWVTQTAASSARIYYESRHAPSAPPRRVDVPTACADFPKEIIWSPRKWLEARYNIVRWTEMPKGGHFAALEQPELLVTDIRAFFAGLR